MVAGLEPRVSQQPVVRHYRGATRADVEAAYRADAGPAIAAGYMPVGHVWSHDAHGLLLHFTALGRRSQCLCEEWRGERESLQRNPTNLG